MKNVRENKVVNYFPESVASFNGICIQAKDAGYALLASNVSNANFTIDSTPPDGFGLISPANGAWSGSLPIFSWQSATDNFAMQGYQLWLDSSISQDSIFVPTTSIIAKVPLSGGVHTWNVKAIDKAGNARQSNQTWSVRVDEQAPAVFNLLSPPDSAWFKRSCAFGWSPSSDAESGLEKYELHIGAKVVHKALDETSHLTLNLSGSGAHEWYVEAIDAVGNVRESSERRTIFVDNEPPVEFNLVSPNNYNWTSDATPILTWQASQDAGSGLSKYELYVNNNLVIDNISPLSTSIELDSALALAEGSHGWYVNAVDNLGNIRRSAQTFTIKVDLSQPAAFSLKSPTDSSYASFPTPDFSWYASSDSRSGLSHYSLWIDDVMSVDKITTTTSSPSTPLTEGTHLWYIRAVDNVGNWQESDQRWTIIGEWNPPEAFDLVFPPDGSTVFSGMPAFGWHKTTDTGSGVEQYQLWIDGVLDTDNIPNEDSLAIPTNPLSNGTHYWFVKAIDRAGNERPSSSTWQAIVDRTGNLAPEIQTVVKQTATEDELFALKITASDPNPTDVLRFSDNTDLFDIDRFSGEISFTPTNEDVGDHNITIVATDGDLSDSTNFVLTVENVNDEPRPFVLLYPAHFAIVDTLNPILVWQKSIEIDKGDSVHYRVYVDTVATFFSPLIFNNVSDTAFTIPYSLKKSTEYFWKVEAIDLAGAITECDAFFKFTTSETATKVWHYEQGEVPEEFALLQNYPNPFNPETFISFQLPHSEKVEIIIYNQVGQAIRRLSEGEMNPGRHQVVWDAKNDRGEQVSSGIYLCQMVAGSYREMIKMLLLK